MQPLPSLTTRLLRGAALTSAGFAVQQVLRFGSNLILARLLFPEAFGLMALMVMVLTGLTMLSDTGVPQSIMQHKRGDDPDFLNTGWTLNLLRGGVLWLVACALAWPLGQFYDAPELALVIPIGGLTLIISGLAPTRVFTAQRHLLLGRITVIELAAQGCGIVAMVMLAWATGSYWALVAGNVLTALIKLALEWLTLPGTPNRLRWERTAARDLLSFGGWIVLSSAFGFLLAQGDRAILGRFLTLEQLGIYNIAWFLASFPMMLATMLVSRMLIPAYRESREADDVAAAVSRLNRMRLGLSGAILALLALMVLTGPWLVGVLYDDRYALAGPIIVVIAAVQSFLLVGLTYDSAALAAGDSRRFFNLMMLRAGFQTGFFLIGALSFGLLGALAGQALGAGVVYPFIARLARRFDVWDPRHDALFWAGGAAVAAAGLWLHRDAIAVLSGTF